MPRLKTTAHIALLFFAAAILLIGTIWGAIWVSRLDTKRAEAAYPKCEGRHKTWEVIIEDDAMNPDHIDAKRCDVLIIENQGDRPRIIAFGQHEEHIAYGGVRERYLSERGEFSVKLVQPGTFLFHDHTQPEVRATFTVNQ